MRSAIITNKIENNVIPLTQRTRLIKVEDSIVTPSTDCTPFHGGVSAKESKHKLKEPVVCGMGKSSHAKKKNVVTQKDFLLLHEQKFHPEMTSRYFFKEGKYSMMNPNDIEKEKQSVSEISEVIGPKSFVPIMILGKGSFGEVYLVQK